MKNKIIVGVSASVLALTAFAAVMAISAETVSADTMYATCGPSFGVACPGDPCGAWPLLDCPTYNYQPAGDPVPPPQNGKDGVDLTPYFAWIFG